MTIGSGVKIAEFGVKSLCGFVPVLAHNLQNPLSMRSRLGLHLAASVSKPEEWIGQGSTFSFGFRWVGGMYVQRKIGPWRCRLELAKQQEGLCGFRVEGQCMDFEGTAFWWNGHSA